MEIDSSFPTNEHLSESEDEENKEKNTEPGLRFIQGPIYGRAIHILGYNETIASVAANLALINHEGDYYIGFKSERIEFDIGRLKTLVSVFPSQLQKRGYISQIVAYMSVEASPRGCAHNFKSLLATCTDDHRVVVYQPSNDPNSIPYVQIADVSQLLYKEYNGTEFEVVDEVIQPSEYSRRLDLLSTLSVSWSPILCDEKKDQFVLLCLSGKSKTSVWKLTVPYTSKKPNFKLIHTFLPHNNWTTISQFSPSLTKQISNTLFAIGSCDGTVKLFNLQGNSSSTISFSQYKEVCKADLNPVFGLCWYVDKENNLLAIGKGLDICIYNVKEDSILYKYRAHTNAITELTWLHTKPILVSSSLDGTIRTWEISHSNSNQLKERRLLYQHIDGIFGIGVSPNDTILVFLQRVPGVRDVMYEAKKPSTVIRLLPLEEEITAEECIDHILKNYNSRLVTWDIKNRLMRHEDQYISLMRKLENDYFSIQMEKIDEILMEAKLSQINKLVVANSFAYDGLQSHPGNSDVLLGINRNDFEIKQIHVWKSLRKFFATSSITSIDEQEKLSLLLMADWIVFHHDQVLAPLLQLAQKIYVAFGSKRESDIVDKLKDNEDSEFSLPEREKCPFCEIALRIGKYERLRCDNGHVLARCSRSFLLLKTNHIWHCGCCQRKSLIFQNEEGSKNIESKFEWLLAEESPYCLHCGTGFSVLRFSSFMKTTRYGVK